MRAKWLPAAVLVTTLCAPSETALAADWPQFQREATHAGDAADEKLRLPLVLATCVRLDDAVTTSPAVVAGKVYVIDQMGTAYAVDPRQNRVLWKTAPDGEAATGGNSSSACVANGRVCYGTTGGRFHLLDAEDGAVVKSLDLGSPILGSCTFANDSLYVQTLDGVVICLAVDGRVRWRWDHYATFVDKQPSKRASGFPGSFQDPHYAGGEVAVSGKRVVVNMGWDLFCLEDTGDAAKLVWCNRAPLGKDPGIPMGPAISGDWIYLGHPGTDQFGGMIRVRLADGSFDETRDYRSSAYPGSIWAVLATPAVRGETAFVPAHYMGVQAFDFAAGRRRWYARTDNTLDQSKFTSSVSSPALSAGHCAFGTVTGELHVVAIDSAGAWPDFTPAPYRFRTPFGKPITSSPAIADGAVWFGCDDGYLYGLRSEGEAAAVDAPRDEPPLHQVRSRVEPATGKRYGAPVTSIDQANSGCVDDPGLKPPFRLRWASRPWDLRVQLVADEDSAYFIAEAGTVAALEQATGRIRWRRRLNGPIDGWKQMLLDRGRLYVTRNSTHPDRKPGAGGSELLCLEAATGRTLWSQTWGSIQGTCRTSTVVVGDVVAGFTATGSPPKPVALAFDARDGEPKWRRELPAELKKVAGGACVLDGVMYFSCGESWGKGKGSTIAVEPSTGHVLWTNAEHHVHGYGRPAGKEGRLYLGGQAGAPMYCISAKDGTLLWQQENLGYSHSPSLGNDGFVVRGYGGYGVLRELATGRPVRREGKEILGGCPDHACSPVLMTTGDLSLAVSTTGLYVRDLKTGEVVWQSRGFAPRACTSPIAANGRLFFSPNVNNALYCFEPTAAR